jgi:hypothetical protein
VPGKIQQAGDGKAQMRCSHRKAINRILQVIQGPHVEEELLASSWANLCIDIIRTTAGLIRKDRVAKISIQAHLLDFLRRQDLDAADTVHKLSEHPNKRM